jgi:hypothetical protein
MPNLRVRWCIATSSAEADLLLPAEASLVRSATADLGQVGSFNLTAEVPGNVAGTYNVGLVVPYPIPNSAPEHFLFFRHALGATADFFVSAVEEL